MERDGAAVRLITKGGYDWTKRFLWIVEAALKNRIKQFVIARLAKAIRWCLFRRILPTQVVSGRSQCYCGAEIDSASIGPHIAAEHMT